MADANVDSTQQAQDAQTLDNLTSLQQTDTGTTAPTGGSADATVTTTNPPAPDAPSLYNETTGTYNNQADLEAAGTNSLLDTTTLTNDGRTAAANESPTIGSGVTFGTEVNTGETQLQYTVTQLDPTIQGSGTNGTQTTTAGAQGTAAATTEATATAAPATATETTTTAAPTADVPTTNSTPAPTLNPDGTSPADPTIDSLSVNPTPQEPTGLLAPLTLKIFAVNSDGTYSTANTIGEQGGTGQYIVLAVDSSGNPLPTQPSGDVTVNVGGGNASRGADYTSNATKTATVNTVFSITAIDDALADNNETFQLTLQDNSWTNDGLYENVVYTGSVTTTISDAGTAGSGDAADTAFTLKIFAVNSDGTYSTANTIGEQGGTGQYIVLAVDSSGNPLPTQPSGDVTVNVGGGNASRGADYTSNATKTATVNTVFSITAIDDALADNNETFQLTLQDNSWTNDGLYENVVYTGSVTTTISDAGTAGSGDAADTAFTLKIFAVNSDGTYSAANTIGEQGGTGQYIVLAVDSSGNPLPTQPSGDVTVNVGGGNASRGADYTSNATKTATVNTVFSITAIDDALADNNETFQLTLQDNSWTNDGLYENVVYTGSVTTTISDAGTAGSGDAADTAFTLKIFAVNSDGTYSTANTIGEQGGTGQYIVLAVDSSGNPLPTQPSGDVTVNVGGGNASRGADYTSNATKTATVNTVFSITAIDDALADNNETFQLTLQDNSWTNDGLYENVVYTGSVTTTISDAGTAGSGDAADTAFTLKIFAVNSDGTYSAANTIGEQGGTGQYIVLAVDSSGNPLPTQPSGDVTVNVGGGNASRGADYTSNATKTATVNTVFSITAIDDALADNNETFQLTLQDNSWTNDGLYENVVYTGSVTTTISDAGTAGSGDAADTAFTLKIFAVNSDGTYSTANTIGEQGGTGQYIVLAVDSSGNPLPTQPSGDVTVNVGGGNASRGADYTSNATKTATVNTVFSITAIDDALADNNETFQLTLQDNSWTNDGLYENVVYTGSVTTTISDAGTAGSGDAADTAFTLKIFAVNSDGTYSTANTIGEQGGTGQYIVLAVDSSGNPLPTQPSGDVTVNVGGGNASRGADYTSNATKTATVNTVFSITAIDDALADNNETFQLTLQDNSWTNDGLYENVVYTGSVTTTISDAGTAGSGDAADTAFTLKIFAVNSDGTYSTANTIGEQGGTGQYIVLAVDSSGNPLPTQPSGDVTVNVGGGNASRGADYTSNATKTATVNTVFSITAIDDALADNNETFQLTLQDNSWTNDGLYENVVYTGSVTTTISDAGTAGSGDAADTAFTLKIFAVNSDGTYSAANTIGEQGGTGQYIVLAVDSSGNPLPTQPSGDVTVNVGGGNASRGADYTSNATKTATVNTVFSITAIDDALADNNETFQLTLQDNSWTNDGLYENVVYTGSVTTTISEPIDHYVTISGLGITGGDIIVNENDLTNGTDASKESISPTASFNVNAPDGVSSIKIAGVEILVNGVFSGEKTIQTTLGNLLTITGFDQSSGVVTYTYTLQDNESHLSPNGSLLTESFSVTIVDTDGDSASANLIAGIVDDAPEKVANSQDTILTPFSSTAGISADLGIKVGADLSGASVQITAVDGASLVGQAVKTVDGYVLKSNGEPLTYQLFGGGGLQAVTADGDVAFTITPTIKPDGSVSYTTAMVGEVDPRVSSTFQLDNLANKSYDPEANNLSNRWLQVLDSETGAVSLRFEGYKDAAGSGNNIVYDQNISTLTSTQKSTQGIGVENNFIGNTAVSSGSNYDGKGEKLNLVFSTNVIAVGLKLDQLDAREIAIWEALDADGNVVDSGEFLGAGQGGSNAADQLYIANSSHAFKTLSLSAAGGSEYSILTSDVIVILSDAQINLGFSAVITDGDGDKITTDSFDVTFDGLLKSDTSISGNEDSDALLGSVAADILLGGAGADTLMGGGGADLFKYSALTDLTSSGAVEKILDFSEVDNDKIDFGNLLAGLSESNLVNTIKIDSQDGSTSYSQLAITLGGQTYLLDVQNADQSTLDHSIMELDSSELFGDNKGPDAWTDVVDLSSSMGALQVGVSAPSGGSGWTFEIKNGASATVDEANKTVTFSAEADVVIHTTDGVSHEINNVDKIQWHG